MTLPTEIRTVRLLLRPFYMEDSATVRDLAGDPLIAAGVLAIPHPYTITDAEQWIVLHPELRQRGEEFIFAVTERPTGILAGAVGLRVKREHAHAELGYWIGLPYTGMGYATEAARAMLEFGFCGLGLQRIYARHFAWNTASGRVLEKIGMKNEGRLKDHALKWGTFQDIQVWGIVREVGVSYLLSGEWNPVRPECRDGDHAP